ncbi:MAG: thioesterase [Tannerellaceae bacterium]|nr:acyl-[acyl-carrier-protein] thioesterase [Tannerellaceae bacterium]MCD8263208.1 thioesterase [Tannerellaceae bacterium]
MDKLGKFHFATESYLLDFQGKLPIPTIGNYLLHAASSHAGARGFGYSDMTEKQTAWVLSRLAIEMTSYPRSSGQVILYTWIDEVGKLFTGRCFELCNEEGKTLGFARSIWAAIDMNTRRPTLLDVERLSEYLLERACPIEKLGKIKPVENNTEGELFRVRYSDLDINGHLNSIKYMEHLLNMFDISLYREKQISRFEIAYQSEGRYGMELSLHMQEAISGKYDMAICNEGKAICRAAVTWK